MTYTIKEQLIILLLNNIPYSSMSTYLNTVTSYNMLQEKMTLNQIQRILNQLNQTEKTSKKAQTVLNVKNPDYVYQLSQLTVMMGESAYPSLWYFIHQPPLIFFYRGDLSLIKSPKLSVIGTRQITPYGKQMTYELVDAFSQEGWVSVSGLALGVDACVHQSAINHPRGKTIAIVPCGLDHYYPKANQILQKKIENNHLILSEYLPLTKPQRHQFILRNRLVAGIAKATIVIEAAQKSGSLITANYALQFNRELFVLPGRLTDSQSIGCNELIEAGATPIVSIDKLIEDIRQI